jgi:hypothetical protein
MFPGNTVNSSCKIPGSTGNFTQLSVIGKSMNNDEMIYISTGNISRMPYMGLKHEQYMRKGNVSWS